MPIISGLQRLRQEDLKFEVSMVARPHLKKKKKLLRINLPCVFF
jgi:hypothetical protein